MVHRKGLNDRYYIDCRESFEIYKFKAKDSEINAAPLSLGNDLKEFLVDNMIMGGLHWYVYDFLVSYDSINVADILDIHKYLMKKTWYKMFVFTEKMFIGILNA